MTESILRLPDVKAKTGLSRSSIYAFIKEGQFPTQKNLGLRSVGWLESDINKWINARAYNKEGSK
jgi:prophage regulatory protein